MMVSRANNRHLKAWICSLAAIILLGGAASTRADVYRYVDEDGVVHFTNTPSSSRFKLYILEKKDGLNTDDHRRLRQLDPLLRRASRAYGVDLPLIQAVIKVESDFDHLAISSKGAQGLMQLMPETAQDLGVVNCFNPIENVYGGVRYLRQLLEDFHGRLQYALAAYNAGKDTVMKYGGIPPYPETQQYVQKVLRYYGMLKRNGNH